MVTTEYDENGEYVVFECDKCGSSETTLYEDNEQLCLNCLLEKHKEEFIADLWDDIVDTWGRDWAEGFEEVEG
jgi:hypothetical protein